MSTTIFYRPVGEKELDLVRASGWKAFPPRLPEQPVFYPVLNQEYAIKIARDWNARDGKSGYVLRFAVESEYLMQFPVQTVGSRIHQEYWIPSERLYEFNNHIVGKIEIVITFHSSQDELVIDP